MKKNKLIEILKLAFGKEQDTRVHAIAMLCIFFVFIIVLVAFLGNNKPVTNQDINGNNNKENKEINKKIEDNNEEDNDINYSYSYILEYDSITETYLGKRIDNKEKFILIKDGVSLDYAKVGDSFLKLENGKYHITDSIDHFKYFNMETLLELLESHHSSNTENGAKYEVITLDLANKYKDPLVTWGGASENEIIIRYESDTIKEVTMNLDNYISCVKGDGHTLRIKMEFANIGTTEDFNIEM